MLIFRGTPNVLWKSITRACAAVSWLWACRIALVEARCELWDRSRTSLGTLGVSDRSRCGAVRICFCSRNLLGILRVSDCSRCDAVLILIINAEILTRMSFIESLRRGHATEISYIEILYRYRDLLYSTEILPRCLLHRFCQESFYRELVLRFFNYRELLKRSFFEISYTDLLWRALIDTLHR